MKIAVSKSIYFVIASILTLVAIVTKYALVDTDLGARFKDFDHELLSSDIIFFIAFSLAIIGLLLYFIRKNSKSTLNGMTVIISAILILPITVVIASAPFVETFHPGEVGDSSLGSFFTYLTIIGTFSTFGWAVLIVITFVRQLIVILTSKKEG
ncbi:hypothetical protein [Mangrovibacterium lignilyticum]|uniref:hypothetical protein n=1 Tax=Mangrovibacterium lignilyticum TaxID=2668052 RepID=UPI0013D50092|nr:hypothetical protein [Mangrovibacterium lignilyticum]